MISTSDRLFLFVNNSYLIPDFYYLNVNNINIHNTVLLRGVWSGLTEGGLGGGDALDTMVSLHTSDVICDVTRSVTPQNVISRITDDRRIWRIIVLAITSTMT